MKEKEMASIVKESRKKQRKNILWLSGGIILIALGIGAYFLFSRDSSLQTASNIPQIVEPTKGDIRVSIESDGSIINPNMVDLSFLIDGTISSLYVQEGDRVEAGQLLAQLDTRDLEFDLRSAKSALQIAYANYEAKAAMLTDTQLKELENSLSSQEDELDSITRDVDQSLRQALDLGLVELDSVFPTLDSELQTIDTILLVDSHYSDNYMILSATNDSKREQAAKNLYQEVRRELDAARSEYEAEKQLSNSNISNYLRKVRVIAQKEQTLMDEMVNLMRSATASGSISQSKIDAVRDEVSSANTRVLSEVTSLTSTIQKIESAYLSQQNKILSAENSITKLQTQIETATASVGEKEVSKQTSLNILSAQITQAKIKVEQAQYDLDLAKLTAPISGEVIQVNGSEGETIKIQSTSSDTAFIKILSDSNFTTEVYVEEIDIAQIQKGQKVIITMDAIPDLELEGVVTFISSIATTSSSGVVTYLVRVEITDSKDAPIKEGMTTYVEFLTKEAVDAILLPVKAVTSRGNRSVVQLENGETRTVETGVSDGSMIEIVSGLTMGEKVVIGGMATTTTGTPKRAAGRKMSEEMITKMQEAGFTEAEIEKAKAGEMTDEMKAKLKEAMGGSASTIRVPGMGGGRPH
jgi:HlyD family secretion protein